MPASSEHTHAVISTYERAAEANRQTPGRHGNVVSLTPELADDCLISGDLHGHVKNFEAILRLAALADHPRRHLVLQEVCHGGPTYPNGGCKSHRMLEQVAELKAAFPGQVHFLLSNHELSELTDYPILKAKKMLNLMFRMGMQEAYGDAANQVRGAYCEFLKTCPLAVRLASGVFVCHSLPEQLDRRTWDRGVLQRPLDTDDMREHSDVFDLVWGRDHRADNAHAFASLVGSSVLVHGHEPCAHGYAVPNDTQVIIDSCHEEACYMLLPVGGTLTQQDIVERIGRLA
jgi:hypothetical protein